MSDLKSILDRLLRENLHGPIDSGNDSNSPENQAIRQAATVAGQTPGTDRHQDQGNPYQQVKDQDLDAHDPRWRELFNEFFVSDQSDDKHDDLLFFVQRASYEVENGGLGVDPVFVKRKVKGGQRVLTAQQEAVVLWKDTFFLNVIVQLQCKLTVAVCTREALRDPKTGEKKSSITTRKFVSKRVYASPTKSRMDVKEESVECSWPLIYYVIDDFEDSFEQLMLQENEHLCVELAVELPTTNQTSLRSKQESDAQRDHHAGGQHADKVQVGRPFPTGSSRGGSKIMLFQGAVGFSNLLGIYQQKAASKVGRRFKLGPHTVPTEFIMMRGPRGRGHAQERLQSDISDKPNIA
ncbi:hypothetical protein BGZ51_008809 [Haplosporangium sp. Z 767]|nr:hypothetical protein BGZ50_008991 [Haplosporangium sp. Z 11]KAF9177403.1 hypothetical protein BGZ51_008809 [Haplosporangium sp. Z 767]